MSTANDSDPSSSSGLGAWLFNMRVEELRKANLARGISVDNKTGKVMRMDRVLFEMKVPEAEQKVMFEKLNAAEMMSNAGTVVKLKGYLRDVNVTVPEKASRIDHIIAIVRYWTEAKSLQAITPFGATHAEAEASVPPQPTVEEYQSSSEASQESLNIRNTASVSDDEMITDPVELEERDRLLTELNTGPNNTTSPAPSKASASVTSPRGLFDRFIPSTWSAKPVNAGASTSRRDPSSSAEASPTLRPPHESSSDLRSPAQPIPRQPPPASHPSTWAEASGLFRPPPASVAAGRADAGYSPFQEPPSFDQPRQRTSPGGSVTLEDAQVLIDRGAGWSAEYSRPVTLEQLRELHMYLTELERAKYSIAVQRELIVTQIADEERTKTIDTLLRGLAPSRRRSDAVDRWAEQRDNCLQMRFKLEMEVVEKLFVFKNMCEDYSTGRAI
ncbi:hypothetical protein F4805DRAFT_435204 [Annulohypoxylon moriforme]|nr:hypothetical protein F4805DRAFT_435204 [Annulohypoxylon moriforme]